MKKDKFNSDYGGDILVIGFTGDGEEIDKFLKENFKVSFTGKFKEVKKEQYNLWLDNHIVMHIETFSKWDKQNTELMNFLNGLRKKEATHQ